MGEHHKHSGYKKNGQAVSHQRTFSSPAPSPPSAPSAGPALPPAVRQLDGGMLSSNLGWITNCINRAVKLRMIMMMHRSNRWSTAKKGWLLQPCYGYLSCKALNHNATICSHITVEQLQVAYFYVSHTPYEMCRVSPE